MNQVDYVPAGRRSYKDSEGQWDELIVEAPLRILIEDLELSNIRTPGDDMALIQGFLLSEGFVPDLKSVEKITVDLGQGSGRDDDMDEVRVSLNSALPKVKFQRGHEIRPSCGLCGDSTLANDIPRAEATKIEASWDLEIILKAPAITRTIQELFQKTGACHGAALFDQAGEMLHVAEDVGRHNAVDKVIGKAAAAGIDFSKTHLTLSGRCGYELISKAVRVGIPILSSVSGITSMSMDLAKKGNIVLIGFSRDGKGRVYNDPGYLIKK
jgi:FdhD protein